MRYLILILLLTTSCETSSSLISADCDCEGPVSQILAKEPAIVEYTGYNEDILRLFIKSGGQDQYTYALVPCDQKGFPSEFKKNNAKVLISGQQRRRCSDTGRTAGYPFTLTKIEVDSNKAE